MRAETARKKSASGTAFPCTYMPLKLTIANFFVFVRFLEENRLERPIRQNLDMPEGRAKRAPRSSGNLPYIETYEDFMRALYSDTQKSEDAREAIKMPLKNTNPENGSYFAFFMPYLRVLFFRVFLCRKEETCNRTALKAKYFFRSHPSRRYLVFLLQAYFVVRGNHTGIRSSFYI